MDAFYASVEQRDNPDLVGKPVVVGGKPEVRGVVAAASYEARRFGVFSAMPSSIALGLCPDAVFVPMRMNHYAEISNQIRTIFHRYTPLVEPLALDEAFLDVQGSTQLFGTPVQIAKSIKSDIFSELRLTASAGVAKNKFLAKLASDMEKPDGLVCVPFSCQAFLDPLPVTRLWGIGKVAAAKLSRIGIYSIYDFRTHSTSELEDCLGYSVHRLRQLAIGEDKRAVKAESTPVTISRETTFSVDVENLETLESTLLLLTEDVAARLRQENLSCRTIGIKLRFANFKTITREETRAEFTNVTQQIWKNAQKLLQYALSSKSFRIRLIGIRLGALESTSNISKNLFADHELEQQKKIDSVVDEINKRFGKSMVRRGGNFGTQKE